MPIQINLLSENIAAEEAKRNDPVKQATWVGVFCVFLVLLWYSTLIMKHMVVASRLQEKQTEWGDLEDDNKSIRALSTGITKATGEIAALDRLATNRFLWAPVLDALTQTMVEEVELINLKTTQSYVVVAPPDDGKKRKKKRPKTATEKISVVLDARDYGEQAQQNYNTFRDVLAQSDYFQSELGAEGLKLAQLLPPTEASAAESGRAYVQFTLECKFPERVRK